MVSDGDIYRAANMLIAQHGSKALEFARARALVSLDKDDWRAATIWCRVVVAIEVLSAPATGLLS